MNNNIVLLLKATVEVIDLVTPRGAFRGDEIFQVGAIRGDLLKLIEAEEAAQKTADEASPESKDS